MQSNFTPGDKFSENNCHAPESVIMEIVEGQPLLCRARVSSCSPSVDLKLFNYLTNYMEALIY